MATAMDTNILDNNEGFKIVTKKRKNISPDNGKNVIKKSTTTTSMPDRQRSTINKDTRTTPLPARPIRTSSSIKDRTVTLVLPRKSPLYTMEEVLCGIIDRGVNSTYIEAVGQIRTNTTWNVTLTEDGAYRHLLKEGKVIVARNVGTVSRLGAVNLLGRLHWLPWHVEEADIRKALPPDVKIVSFGYMQNTEGVAEGVYHLTRNVRFEAKSIEDIPFKMTVRSSLDNTTLDCLITVKGRQPRCLKCDQTGHISRECESSFCLNCNKFVDHLTEECKEPTTYSSKLRPKINNAPEILDDGEDALHTVNNANTAPPKVNRPPLSTSEPQSNITKTLQTKQNNMPADTLVTPALLAQQAGPFTQTINNPTVNMLTEPLANTQEVPLQQVVPQTQKVNKEQTTLIQMPKTDTASAIESELTNSEEEEPSPDTSPNGSINMLSNSKDTIDLLVSLSEEDYPSLPCGQRINTLPPSSSSTNIELITTSTDMQEISPIISLFNSPQEAYYNSLDMETFNQSQHPHPSSSSEDDYSNSSGDINSQTALLSPIKHSIPLSRIPTKFKTKKGKPKGKGAFR